jgi:hypothetical protein
MGANSVPTFFHLSCGRLAQTGRPQGGGRAASASRPQWIKALQDVLQSCRRNKRAELASLELARGCVVQFDLGGLVSIASSPAPSGCRSWRTQRVGAMTVRLCQQASVAGERPAIRGLPSASGSGNEGRSLNVREKPHSRAGCKPGRAMILRLRGDPGLVISSKLSPAARFSASAAPNRLGAWRQVP